MSSLAEKAAQIRERLLHDTLQKNKNVEHPITQLGQPIDQEIRSETKKHPQNLENGWSPETENLINWFLGETHLPVAPFELYKGVTVTNEMKFYESLRLEISMGPKGYRARTGVLQDDLEKIKKLKEVCEQSKYG